MSTKMLDNLIALLREHQVALSSSGERHDQDLVRLFQDAVCCIENARSLAGRELQMPETQALLRGRWQRPVEPLPFAA